MNVFVIVVGSVLAWILCGALSGRFVYTYAEGEHHVGHPGGVRGCKDCKAIVGVSMFGGPVTVAVLLIWGVCHIIWAYGTRPTRAERVLVQRRRAEANERELTRVVKMSADAQVRAVLERVEHYGDY